ncbi:MAG: protein-L-isoaspartate O-methyltransferase [Bacteroidetes bacterium]|jgi:protein-L-isoaspartate(D-aspartate) O-methyltransferase|nr:protein-L-isoaspartate O-methyltransferase [Bacteroidota bacterium]
MTDNIQHKQHRAGLVESIRQKGFTNDIILKAIERVPRHLFVDEDYNLKEIYTDQPLDIGLGQTISQPYTVAFQTSLLELNRGDKVLEIGTGSGYQSAVLFELGANVFSIERQQALFNKTKEKLASLGYNAIKLFYGDGHEGLPANGPYDKILITAAAPEIPGKLLKQLKTGGIMVVPVNKTIQQMIKVTKISDTEIETEACGHFNFVPMLPGIVME